VARGSSLEGPVPTLLSQSRRVLRTAGMGHNPSLPAAAPDAHKKRAGTKRISSPFICHGLAVAARRFVTIGRSCGSMIVLRDWPSWDRAALRRAFGNRRRCRARGRLACSWAIESTGHRAGRSGRRSARAGIPTTTCAAAGTWTKPFSIIAVCASEQRLLPL
jgi:hypothetical protein